MSAAGTATLHHGKDGDVVAASGDWTLASAPTLSAQVAGLRRAHGAGLRVDAAGIGRMDTAGARLLLDLAGAGDIDGLDETRKALVDVVAKADVADKAPAKPDAGLIALLARTGAAAEQVARDAWQLVGFIGLVLATLARCAFVPRRWRVTSLAFHLEQTGLDAVPIVVLLNFLVGAVVAFLGATVLKDFGATIFTVELIGYSFLREFGVLLTAILIAGRSGSAFTAQIGSMKSREASIRSRCSYCRACSPCSSRCRRSPSSRCSPASSAAPWYARSAWTYRRRCS
jgi:phospholipid/cholesterol/gamma-HCH transport system permease protein